MAAWATQGSALPQVSYGGVGHSALSFTPAVIWRRGPLRAQLYSSSVGHSALSFCPRCHMAGLASQRSAFEASKTPATVLVGGDFTGTRGRGGGGGGGGRVLV